MQTFHGHLASLFDLRPRLASGLLVPGLALVAGGAVVSIHELDAHVDDPGSPALETVTAAPGRSPHVRAPPIPPFRRPAAPSTLSAFDRGRSLMGGGHGMEAQSRLTRWTYAEYARLPSEGSTRYEVIAGELVVTPSPSLRHQRISMELATRLHGFVREHGLGDVFHAPLDVLLAEGDYLEPDLVFVRADHRGYFTDRGIEGPPDLVVEILSPSTATRDRGLKLERYRHFGVPEYWVVDPDARAIEVWCLAAGAQEPEVLGVDDTLRWEPGPGTAALDVVVGEVVGERDV